MRKSKPKLPDAASSGPTPAKVLQCDFCEKTQFEVRKLIAGKRAFICDECIDLCAAIIEEEEWDAARSLQQIVQVTLRSLGEVQQAAGQIENRLRKIFSEPALDPGKEQDSQPPDTA